MRPLSRRTALAQLAVAPLVLRLPQPALPPVRNDRRLVVVPLRGGLDGLAALPPHGDRNYRAARGGLALPPPGSSGGMIDLDGFFGLHPAMASLHEFYARGELLAVAAVATSYRGRSHAEAQGLLDNGTANPNEAASGWLGRATDLMAGADRSVALSMGEALPLLLRSSSSSARWAPQEQAPAISPQYTADEGADGNRVPWFAG
jgi:uncharacterized protein (DUF1501 family)